METEFIRAKPQLDPLTYCWTCQKAPCVFGEPRDPNGQRITVDSLHYATAIRTGRGMPLAPPIDTLSTRPTLKDAIDSAFEPLRSYMRDAAVSVSFELTGPPADAVITGTDPDALDEPGKAEPVDRADFEEFVEDVDVITDNHDVRIMALEAAVFDRPVNFYAKITGDGSLVANHVAIRHATAAFWRALGIESESVGHQTEAGKGRYIITNIEVKGEAL